MDLVVRVVVVVVLLGAAALLGTWWNRRDGRVRAAPGGGFAAGQLAAVGLDPSGADALGLLLGSPTCAPCETVERILAEVAGTRPSFRWVKVDAADHLDLAAAHHVMRVPTLFVLGADGRILARTSGVPALTEVLAAIDRGGASAA